MKFEVLGYQVTSIIEGGKFLHEQSVSFIAEKDGVSFPLKTKFDNEFISDLHCVMGLDPVKELANIAIAEITKELRDPQEEIRKKWESIDRQEEKLARELSKLQLVCSHPNAKKEYRSNTGNYDPSADSYWIDFQCPDCRKKWWEAQ